MRKLFLTAIAVAFVASAADFRLDSVDGLELVNAKAEAVNYRGRHAVRLDLKRSSPSSQDPTSKTEPSRSISPERRAQVRPPPLADSSALCSVSSHTAPSLSVLRAPG
jgi:hypothetical protein